MIIENGTFTWGHGEEDGKAVLKDLNLTVEKGSLVAVVGSVGAGKSSLCSAILGEMEKQSGRITLQVRMGKVVWMCVLILFSCVYLVVIQKK